MASVVCPSCGTPNAAGTPSCLRCGRPLVQGQAPAPPALSYPPPLAQVPYSTPWGWSGQPPVSREVDGPALSRVQMFALLSLIGTVLGLAVEFGVGPFYNYSAFGLTSTSATSLSTATVVLLTGLLLLGVVFSVVSLIVLRQGFVQLRPHDSRFSTPATLVLLGVIGLLLLFLGLIALLSALASLIACAAGATTVPTSCVNVGALLGGIGLAGIGAILALIGIIGGILGLWRVGERHDQTMIKVGAILWIFPFLNIVGLVLILWGLSQARERLEGAGRPAMPAGI